MKKLILAAAVASAVSTVQAAPVTSNITGLGLWLGNIDFFNAPLVTEPTNGYAQNIAVGGDTNTGLTFTGYMLFNAGMDVRVTFNLSAGQRQGVNGAGGTIFTGGNVDVDTNLGDGSGWVDYAIIDASVTNIAMISGANTHVYDPNDPNSPSCPTVCTSGLVVGDAAGVYAMPGLWDGASLAQLQGEVAAMNLLGFTTGLFLQGTVTVQEVPVPAAAWLFGSALVGMAGVARKRKMA